MYRRHVLAGISALPISGCFTTSQSEKTNRNQTTIGTDSRHTTTECWELSKRQGFRIHSGYNDTVSLKVTASKVKNQSEERVFQRTFSVDYQGGTTVRDAVFTEEDTTYRVVAEGLNKTESEMIDGGDEDWRLRRIVLITIQENGGLGIGSVHVDGDIPPACE